MTRRPSRRDICKWAGASLATMVGLDFPRAMPATTLAAAAKTGGLLFGTAAGPEVINDLAYRKLVIDQASVFVPQNAMKFDALQPQRGQFRFTTADTLVNGARDAGLLVRGHNLFWNDWLPDWVKSLSNREVEDVFNATLETIVPHFAGRLQSWDVVNEPFYLGRDHPGTFRQGAWYNAMGPDYIYKAFRRVAELDPHAKLVLNEAWTEREDPVGLAVRKSLLNLIDRMLDKGLKLDVIGLQGHLTPSIAYDDASFADFLHAIAERKVDIYITEFDIDDQFYPDDIVERDRKVAARTAAFLRHTLSVPAVKMIITWGLSDRYTWWRLPEIVAAYNLGHTARPLPFDDRFQPKPMWQAMVDEFQRRPKSALR